MISLFKKQKKKLGPESPLPLGLSREKVNGLKEFRASVAYEAFQEVIERVTENRMTRLFKPGTPEEHNFDRGVMFAYREMYSLIDQIVLATERWEQYERNRRNGDGDGSEGPLTRLWGSPNYADEWQR